MESITHMESSPDYLWEGSDMAAWKKVGRIYG